MIPSLKSSSHFFRRAGSVAYGFGLFSRRLSFEDYGAMFHGNDERVSIESLRQGTNLIFQTLLEVAGRR